MSDIVQRIRDHASQPNGLRASYWMKLAEQAADEVERLRGTPERRKVVPRVWLTHALKETVWQWHYANVARINGVPFDELSKLRSLHNLSAVRDMAIESFRSVVRDTIREMMERFPAKKHVVCKANTRTVELCELDEHYRRTYDRCINELREHIAQVTDVH